MNQVAIILARGGSKGFPKKNIVNFCGKPLLAWSIKQAKSTKGISSVWVSSDSDEILGVAESYDSQIIKRPNSLASDNSTSEEGWLHAISEIEKQDKSIDLVVGIQATSPLREPSDIEKGLTDFVKLKCDSMFSCSVLEDFFLWKKEDDNFISTNYDFKNRVRRQDIENQYLENGSFYIFTPELLRNLHNRLGKKIGIAKMEFWKSFEIDSQEDLKLCEILMRNYLLHDRK